MMRYSLSQGDGSGRVPLVEEWQQVHNFIELNQLRYEKALPITLTETGDFGGVYVLPHLFITLVENMFKHGDFRKPATVSLILEADRLSFTVENYILPKIPTKNGLTVAEAGVGLQNIEKRLLYEYVDGAQLQRGDKEGVFKATLSLPVVAGAKRVVNKTPATGMA
jgi:two-component system, LytTR family, sensor kinase